MSEKKGMLISVQLDFNCPDCKQEYNSSNNFPYEICSNGHSVCKECQHDILTSFSDEKCPQCKEIVDYKTVKPIPADKLVIKILLLIKQTKNKDEKLY